MANTRLSRECDAAFLGLPKEVKVWLNEKSVRNKTSNNVTIGKYVMSDYREHIEDSKKSIVSFSGGKDSTALLLMMLERGMKDRIGLGQYFRGLTEHCLFGIRGKLPYKVIDGKRQQGKTGFFEKKREHSRKPVQMREMIEKVSYPPFIELFARERFDGWDAWGNEI